MPDLNRVGLVVRRALRAPGGPVFTDLPSALTQTDPDFVLCLAGPAATPSIIAQTVAAGVPILAEPPPATTPAGLAALTDLADSGLVQIAEPYPWLPDQAAALQVVRSGQVGRVSQVQLSGLPAHAAMALLRAYLGPDQPGPTVRTARFDQQVVVSLDFANGMTGVFTPTDRDHGGLYPRPFLVRGSAGEIAGRVLTRLDDPAAVVTTRLRRVYDRPDDPAAARLAGIWQGDTEIWRNPFPDQAWDDLAIAYGFIVAQMMAFVRQQGQGPYALGEALADARLVLAIDHAVAD